MAVKGPTIVHSEPSTRSSHAGAVGGARKPRRQKSPQPIEITLAQFERLCLSSGGSLHSRMLRKEPVERSSPSILARRRIRAGAHTLQLIDVPIAVDSFFEDTEAPQAPRSGGGQEWRVFPEKIPAHAHISFVCSRSSAASYCSMSEASTIGEYEERMPCELASPPLFLDSSPTAPAHSGGDFLFV